jgi:polyisoprenoid-binding protein YceI
MTRLYLTSFAFFILILNLNAQLYSGKTDASSISFFSKSPLENIEATNKKVTIVLKTTTNDIQFAVPMISFKFPKALMEEHFNENYVESAKYPTSTFKGKINETIDFNADGEYKVSVNGTLDLHGVKKDIDANGTLIINGTEILINSSFKLKVADYGIKVPSLYVKNIAEVVDVKVFGLLEPFVKK